MREDTFRRKKASRLLRILVGEVGRQGGWQKYFARGSEG